MNQLSPDPSPRTLQVLVACLLAFAIFITPISAIAAPSIARATVAKAKRTDKTDKTNKRKSAAEELFVNPPVAPATEPATETGAALPGPKPEPAPEPFAAPIVGAVTATMTAALTATANNVDGKADPGDTINYTVQLGNTTAADATGLSFNPALDSHTTFVPGSIKSTPICFDQTGVATNEDVAKAITLTGQDPDGDTISFSIVTPPAHGGFGITTAPNLTYTPAADYNGPDSFVFRVNDGTTSGAGNNGNSNETCTVSITVNSVNDAPTFTVPGNPAAVNEDAGAQSVSTFISPASVRPAQSGNTTEDSQTVSFVITNNTNPGLFSSAPAINVVGASYPKTATLTYTPAANQNGTAVITYHAHDNGGTANSGVDNSADQTFTITVNAVNDPPVVTPPAAFAVQANMKRTGFTGLLGNVNDNADNGVNGCVSTTFTVTSGSISATTPAGGTISNVNLSTGSFDFDPPPGFTGGNVTFTYTVSDTGCPGVAISAPATVTVAVSGPVIWFVNPALGADGDGRLSNPFKNLATAMDINHMGNLATNQRVFIFSGTTEANVVATLTGAGTQPTAQWLVGQGAIDAGGFDTLMGISPPANTIARPSVNGTRPIVRGTVTMKDNTVVQGLNIDVSAGATKGLTALNWGANSALTIKDVNVTSAGGNAADFSNSVLNGQSITYTTSNSSTSPNILSSTSGTALNVVNTNIGASGLTFKSITSNGGSNGIFLNNTGASGGLTVTGTAGSTTKDGSGGTIQNKTGAEASPVENATLGVGIYLNNTKNVSLNHMNLHDFSNYAVAGTSVNGFTMTYSIINGVNGTGANRYGGFGEGSVMFQGLLTSATIDHSDFSGGAYSTFTVLNNLSQTLNRATFTFCSFAQTDTTGNDALTFQGTGGTLNVTVQDSTFTAARGDLFQIDMHGTISSDLIFGGAGHGNTLSNANTNSLGGGITLGGGGAGNVDTFTFNISNNTMQGAKTGAISIGAGTGAGTNHNYSGTINANTIGVPGTANSGSFGGSDISFLFNDNGAANVSITNNLLYQYNNNGVNLTFGVFGNSNSYVQATVTGNTMSNPGAFGTQGFLLTAGTGPILPDKGRICLTLGGAGALANSLTGSSANGATDIRVRNRFDVKIGFPGYGGTTTDTAALGTYLQGRNGGAPTVSVAAPSLGTTNGTTNGFYQVCPPPLLLAMGGISSARDMFPLVQSFDFSRFELVHAATSAATTSMVSDSLNQQQLDSIVSAAMQRWASTGLTPNQVTALQGLSFEVGSLPGSYLGEADGNRILVDRNAGGKGWFVDANPMSDLSFAHAMSATRLYTDPLSAPAGHVDLLTAIAHEMGHKLGLDDSYQETDRDNLMYGYLTVGERRLPAAGQAAHAVPEVSSGVHFLKLGPSDETRRSSPRVSKGVSASTDALPHGRATAPPQSAIRNTKNIELNHARRSAKANSSATAMSPMLVSGGTFPINGTGSGFSLPIGKTITIKYSVTLNSPPNLSGVPPATPQVSSQGTLSGAFVGNPIVTDDPGTGAVNDATVTLVDLFDTTTTLGAVPAAGSWNVGQSVTFTANVASNPTGNPTAVTGSVIFKDNGTAISGCNGVALSSAQAQCVTTFGSGAHSVTAVYSGDGNFDPSTSSALSQGTVSASGTSTAVTSSLNPSLVTQNVTFTATVTSTSGFAGPPTGTVQFKDNLVNLGSAQTLNGSGVATLITSALLAGNHPITAVYSGDTNFTTSTGTLTGDPQVVNKSDTATVLTSSSNPVAPTVQVTYTATVSSSTSVTGPPTGTVTFKDGVTTIVCEAGSQALTAGVATCKFTYPDTVGSPHDITAVYGGDGTFNGNTSNHVSEVVQACSASVVVTSNADSGANTLRDAIDNGVCAGGTITFDPSVTSITLTTGELAISKNMTITGPGAATLTVNGNNASRVFNVASGKTATISGMTITSGKVLGGNGVAGSAGIDAKGGAVINAGTLTLSNVIVSASHATGGDGGSNTGAGAGGVGGRGLGGGIYNGGTLTLTNTTVNGSNSATGGKGGDTDAANANGNGGAGLGGGVFNTGTLTLTNSTISANTTTGGAAGSGGTAGTTGAGSGGGVYHDATASPITLTITGSTISGNTASSNGGGIFNIGTTDNATLTISNTTISGNGANNDGGGIWNDSATGTTTLTSVTVTGNSSDNDNDTNGAGGGINRVSGTVTLKNTIVAGNLKGSGILQVETATVAETVPGTLVSGNAKVVVTAAGMTGSPETLNVAVATNDDEATVAGKIRADLAANGHVNGFFTVSGAGTAVILTARTVAANDTSLNIDISDDTSAGLAAAPTSANTTPGRTAHDISGNVDAASSFSLIGDAASSGGLAEPNVNNNFVGFTGTGIRHITTILDSTLANNGGPTKTHALVSGSAALETGKSFGLTTDQRGFLRPVNSDLAAPPSSGDDSDIGAFEKQIAPNAPGAPNLDAVSDSGASSTDDKTNVTTNLSFTIPGVLSGATVQLFRDGSPVASGLASGASIQLTDPGPLTFTASGTTYSYTAKQSFGSDTSVASTALPVLITIIPDAPVLDPSSDSGTPGDGITNDTSPTFNITNVVNTATVKLFRDGVEVASGTAAGTTIQLTDPSAPNGTFTYTAKQIFSAVTSDASDGTSITITIKPNAPDLDAASDSGPSSTDNYTSDATPTFTIGGVINGANVELLRDGTSVANGTAVGTSIQLTDPGALDGLHTYKARQTVGITLSPDSDGLDVTIDTSISQPSTPDLIAADDSNVNNDDVTSKTTPAFTGTADPNTVVQLFASGVLKGTGSADNSGAWSITSSALADGPYNMTAVATDLAGNVSIASGALPIVIDTTKPTVTMSSAAGNPTATTPIPVTVTFSEPVTGFTIGDIVPGNGTVGNFAGSGASYTFDLTPTGPGPVSADIAGSAAIDLAGNTNTAATQFNRTFDPSALSVTITPVAPDPRNTSVSSIQIVFNKAVTGFDLPDLSLKRNAGAELLPGAATLTSGDNITWTLGNLSGLTGTAGTYVLFLNHVGSNIKDAANNPLTSDATESWVTDTTAPDVTINQAATQPDPVTGPTATTVINFTAIFTEPEVAGTFTNSDVTISGTAGATVVNITEIAPNDGTHFNVALEGMTQSGTVIATIPAGRASDSAGNLNTASTSTDNTVTYFKDDFTALEVNSVADTDDGFCTALGSGPGANQDCTLREAINAANADAGPETITFNSIVFAVPGPYTINLTGALPDLASDMTITGPGANVLTVRRNAGGNYRIFAINSGKTVTISRLAISNGSGNGGGILNQGTLALTECTVSGNSAPVAGGAIKNDGEGGVATLTITKSTISGNTAPSSGGGIYNDGFNGSATLTMINSTISGNTGPSFGGGVYNDGSSGTAIFTTSNSTISGNTAGSSGGGVYNFGNGGAATFTLRNTILAGNQALNAANGPDVFNFNGAVKSEGFNLIQVTSGAVITETLNPGTNITGVDPQLFPLADNGGPTKTHALQCTSPAIDKGFNFTVTTDQRGGVRPFDLADAIYPNAAGGDGSDIGAYETQTGGGCQPLAVPPSPQPSTNEDTQVTITLKGTYSQNFPLTFVITQQPGHAISNLVPTGTTCTFTTFTECTATVSYKSTLNFNGLDSFKFKASAGGLDSDEADVNITIIPVNDPPVANPQSVITDEDTAAAITLTGSDVDSASLNFIIVTPPAHGSFGATTAPNLTYTPAANYNGPDSFTFKINDGSADSNIATVSITVNAVNDAPVLDNTGNMSLSAINEDVPVASNTGTLVSAVIASAGGVRITDVDAGALTGLAVIAVNNTNGIWQFSLDNGTNWTPFGAPDSLNARLLAADATTRVRFLPNANFNGTVDPGLTFRAWDRTVGANGNTADTSVVGGTTAFSTATETASITVNPVNDAPTADSQSTSTNEDTPLPITLTGSDVETASGSLTFTITVAPSHGTISSGAGAARTYTPAANYNGADSFKFTVTDTGDGASPALTSTEATVTITVNAVNDAPSFTKGPDQIVNGAVPQTIANWATSISAGPPDESAQTLTFLVSNNNNALFSAQPVISPTGTLTFTPAYGFDGTATVTVRLQDSGGTALGGVDTSAPQTFTITVHALNNAPTLNALSNVAINEDAALQTVNLAGITSGPSYESGQTLTVTATSSNPALIPNPSVSYTSPNTTGSISFMPLPDANGSVLITVTVKDNGGTANGGVDTFVRTFTVTVNPVNDAPVNHVPGPQTGTLNTNLVFSTATSNLIFISDVDAGSDPVQVTLQATDGTLTLNSTSGLSFSAGDGTDDALMTFTGSLTNINLALNGMRNLTLGTGVITITTNDLGHNGIGGPLSDTDTIAVTVPDNLAPVLLTAEGTDRAIALDSVTLLRDPFTELDDHNFSSDHHTRVALFALHAQLQPGETQSAITAEGQDLGNNIFPLTVESVRTVPGFDWLTQVVVRLPDVAQGGGGSQDIKVRIRLRGQNSNQAVITIVPSP